MGVPVDVVVNGILTTCGVDVNSSTSPVGSFIATTMGGLSDTVDVNAFGYGRWRLQLERDDSHYPMIHIDQEVYPGTDPTVDTERSKTVMSYIHMPTFPVYYVEQMTQKTLSDNPFQDAILKANALQTLLNTNWKTLGTDPSIVVNARISAPTLINPWQSENLRVNTRIISVLINVDVRIAELYPEVA